MITPHGESTMPNEDSAYDRDLFRFECTKCDHKAPNITVGSIRDDQTTLICASCHFENDLTTGQNCARLAEARELADQKDKQDGVTRQR
jgi:transcription elongation factor Elf1